MIYAVVECEKCGAKKWYDHIGKTHLKRWLREEGWSFGKTIKCPKCNSKDSQNV